MVPTLSGSNSDFARAFTEKGRFGSKNDEKGKVLRMEFSIVENLSGLQESIFNLSRGPQLHSGKKSKNWSNYIKLTDFPLFPLFGVPWAAVILAECSDRMNELLAQSMSTESSAGAGADWTATATGWY